MKGQTLKIATINNEPYMIITKEERNVVYSGFIFDLIKEMSKRCNFNYTLYEVTKFGTFDESKNEWNGIIGEVIAKRADIGAAPLTITRRRELAINFVKPFHHLGYVPIIQRHPRIDFSRIVEHSHFGILYPFTPAVWAFIFLAFVVVSMFLWVMNLFNPYEWGELYNMGLADKAQSESFNMIGSFWYTFSTFQWQGYEKSPRCLASRMISGIWFIFVTLVIAVYTAGVVYHLFWMNALKGMGSNNWLPFLDLQHLLNNKEYTYGVVKGGRVYNYVTQVATGYEFQIMRKYWNSSVGADSLVSATSDGLYKVRSEHFALFLDSMTAKWHINQQPCDLVQIGEPLGKDSYGFAVHTESTILEELHMVTLMLIEDGTIEELEEKWFKGNDQCFNAKHIDRLILDQMAVKSVDMQPPSTIGLDIMWANFLLLFLGLLGGIMVGIGEMFYFKRWGRYSSSNQPQSHQLESDEVAIN